MPEREPPSEMKMMPVQQGFHVLPSADAFGNFWFGPHKGETPAIFRRLGGDPANRPVWMASLGKDGVVFEGKNIKEYRTVIEAFADLKCKLRG